MTPEEFREAIKVTGYQFTKIIPPGFFDGAYCAEIPGKESRTTLYYPNVFGGATLVIGHGPTSSVFFFDTLEEVRKFREKPVA